MPPRKAISKAEIKIATSQPSPRKGIRSRKPTQKILLLQQEAEEKEIKREESDIKTETETKETEKTEKTEKKITGVNNDLAKELKRAFQNLTLKEIQTRIPDQKKVQFELFDQGY